MTVAEYLAFERASEIRHEYVGGLIREMSPSTWRHGVMVGNVGTALRLSFEGRPFAALTVQMRTRAGIGGPYYYPDIVVSPVPGGLEDEHRDTLLNPIVVIDTLTDYALIARDEVRVDHSTRQPDGSWRFVIHDVLSESLFLSSIDAELPVSEFYEKVMPF
jgi:hypothetical protein